MHTYVITLIFSAAMFCKQLFSHTFANLKKVIVTLKYMPGSCDSQLTCHRFDFGFSKTIFNQLKYKVHREELNN